jgi:HD-like signal output (HDOD) protein
MEVVAEYRGVHITHMRSEEARILEALRRRWRLPAGPASRPRSTT